MSTRAIIGILNQQGQVVGAWQWNDGGYVINVLRTHFNTTQKVLELIACKEWSVLLNPLTYHKYERNDSWLQSKNIVEVSSCFVVQDKDRIPGQNFTGDAGIKVQRNNLLFKDLATAFGQDINYLYIWDAKNGKWKTFGQKYSYKKMVEITKTYGTKIADNLDQV